MSTSKNRRLAAILFADIVGYTALMQRDEVQARQNLEKFRNTLNEQVLLHHGEIINYYGDGCLCTFNSAVDAMQCAKEVQTVFLNVPKVPVRIGLHSGDVFFEADNVYGDSVNIASRIESLGVAGAVLFSKQIKRYIANQTAFKVQSIGEFHFKNVKKTMEVFGLANEGLVIPKKENIKGKLKTPPPPKSNKIIYRLIGLVGLISLVGFYFWKTDSTQQKAEIIKERIAVLPFENHTNDADLEVLGIMAADWINQGLMDIEEAEVVSPFTVRSHKTSIGIPANDPQGRPSFAELTGAQNLIVGNYYKEKEELLFKLEIVDALEGKLLYGFEPIRGAVQDKEALISKLRAAITGYWAARDLVDANKIKVPNFEAYKLYTEGLKFQTMSDEKLLEILRFDSLFFLPRLLYLNSQRSYLKDNRHFDFLDRHYAQLSSYEQGFYNFLKHYFAGDTQVAFDYLNAIRKKYPKDFLLNHETAAQALESLFNPALSLEIYNELDIKNFQPTSVGVYYNWRINNYITNLFYLKKWDALADFIANTPPNRSADLTPYYQSALLLPAVQKDTLKINQLLAEIKKSEHYNPYWYSRILTDFNESNLIPKELSPIWQREISWVINHTPQGTELKEAMRHYLAYANQQTRSINLELFDKLIFYNKKYILVSSTLVLIRKENFQEAKKHILHIESLMEQNALDNAAAAVYKYGFAYYNLAQIYSQMGEIDQAMFYLKKAKKAGIFKIPSNFENDPLLAPLYELPEFKELIEPVWPAVKD